MKADEGARADATRLAKRILELDGDLAENMTRIAELVEASPDADLLQHTRIGPVTAATDLVV